MEFYEPLIPNPYPDRAWTTISGFKYRTPLYLMRGIEAVQNRDGEDADYLVGREYRVTFDRDGEAREIVVPRGMITDLSSVPRPTRPIIDRVGPHLEASILHDFLYVAWQSLTGREARSEDRRFADELFLIAMIEAGVGWLKRNAIYSAVRVGGWSAYEGRNEPRYVWLPPDC